MLDTYHFHISKQPFAANEHRRLHSATNIKVDFRQMKLLTYYRCGVYYNRNTSDKIIMPCTDVTALASQLT